MPTATWRQGCSNHRSHPHIPPSLNLKPPPCGSSVGFRLWPRASIGFRVWRSHCTRDSEIVRQTYLAGCMQDLPRCRSRIADPGVVVAGISLRPSDLGHDNREQGLGRLRIARYPRKLSCDRANRVISPCPSNMQTACVMSYICAFGAGKKRLRGLLRQTVRVSDQKCT